MGQAQDDVILVPSTTAQERMLGISYVHSINIQVSDSAKIDYKQKKIEILLHKRHHVTKLDYQASILYFGNSERRMEKKIFQTNTDF